MSKEFSTHEIEGLLLIKNSIFRDDRGAFQCSWEDSDFKRLGIEFSPSSLNHSYNHLKNTLRAFHYQSAPYGQAKLVSCVHGRILDVAVDIDRDSPSFLKFSMVELSGENGMSHLIPRGCAHGFLTLEDASMVSYLIDGEYNPEKSNVIRWNDPRLKIPWPQVTPIMSEKDANAPCLKLS